MSLNLMLKNSLFLILFASVSFSVNAVSRPVPSKEGCFGVQNEIDHINSRMRTGYKVREGERLKDRLRYLTKMKQACRKRGLKVS